MLQSQSRGGAGGHDRPGGAGGHDRPGSAGGRGRPGPPRGGPPSGHGDEPRDVPAADVDGEGGREGERSPDKTE